MNLNGLQRTEIYKCEDKGVEKDKKCKQETSKGTVIKWN